MALLLSLLAIVFLLVLQRVCQSRQLTPPPLRIPLIAAVAIPILTLVLASVELRSLGWLTQSLRTSITLLWVYGSIRLVSWAVMLLPSELGFWKPIPKILRDLLSLAVATAITLVVIHRDFQVNLVGLAATSAVITAVIGLAAQETLKNFFAGISLQVDSPFEEGDWVDLGFTRGVATSLRLMSTRIRTIEGFLTVIPNSRITIEGLRRVKASEPVSQSFEIGLDYSLPPRQAIELLKRTLTTNPKVLKEPSPKVWVSNFGDSAIVYQVLTWQTSAQEQRQLRSDLMEQIWYALQRIDQSIPFPIRDIRTKPSPAKLPSLTFDLESLQRLLAQTEIFSHFTSDQLRQLAQQACCHSYGLGETVVLQGELGTSLYIVVSGSLDVVRSTSQEGLVHISTLTGSDVFGEMGLCTGEPRSANVICKEECVLLEIQRKHLIPLMEESPQILETIGTLMAQRRQRLHAMNQDRAETRRQALISRMQRLFTRTGET